MKIKLRVVSPYRKKIRDYSIPNDTLGPNKGFPMYSFSTFGLIQNKNNSEIISDEIIIFPNPSNGIFNIRLNTIPEKNAIYEIYSLEGAIIKAENIKETITAISIYNKGIYIVKIQNGNKVISRKIIVL